MHFLLKTYKKCIQVDETKNMYRIRKIIVGRVFNLYRKAQNPVVHAKNSDRQKIKK